MKLFIPTYPSTMFTWNTSENGTKYGLAEMSDFGKCQIYSQVYDDAADVGFNVQSDKTGKVKLFTFKSEERDPNSDVVGVYFSSEDGIDILLIND
jgi:hypothetical protein